MRHSNAPRLFAGPAPVAPSGAQTVKFWNIASTGDDSGEILLYGDVVSRQPVDWWTGEPEPGLYIAPESFLEDLAAVKDKSARKSSRAERALHDQGDQRGDRAR